MEYLWIIIIGTSIWAGFDAHALGMKRDAVKVSNERRHGIDSRQ